MMRRGCFQGGRVRKGNRFDAAQWVWRYPVEPFPAAEARGEPVEPTEQENENVRQALIDISVESWRFAKLFGRVLAKLDAGDAPRYANQLRYFLKKVDETLDVSDMRLVNLEGQPYDPGVAASALNVADFGPDDRLVVDQMVEPIVMGSSGLVRPGTVMLRKLEE